MTVETTKKIYLTVKDQSVSGDTFQLLYNDDLEMLETFPQPSLDKLPSYYQSADYISHTDSKRDVFETVYQFIKSISLKRKLKLIDSFKSESKSLLDVGCGTGDFLQIAQNNGWTVLGIEPNEQARQIANQKTNDSVFETEQLFKLKKHSFDVIALWHVLEHLPNLEAQIDVFKNLLKPDGTLIVAVPNFKSHDANHYKEFWAAFDVPRHLWHFSQTAISKLMFNTGLKVVNTLPMKFDAFYVCLLSEKYKFGIMNPVKGIWNGWNSNLKAKRTGEYSSIIYCIKNA